MAQEIQPEPALQVRRKGRVLGGRPELGLLSHFVDLPHSIAFPLRDRTMGSIEMILYKGRAENPGECQEESTDQPAKSTPTAVFTVSMNTSWFLVIVSDA